MCDEDASCKLVLRHVKSQRVANWPEHFQGCWGTLVADLIPKIAPSTKNQRLEWKVHRYLSWSSSFYQYPAPSFHQSSMRKESSQSQNVEKSFLFTSWTAFSRSLMEWNLSTIPRSPLHSHDLDKYSLFRDQPSLPSQYNWRTVQRIEAMCKTQDRRKQKRFFCLHWHQINQAGTSIISTSKPFSTKRL